jgi:hypothetical protein
MLVVLSFEIFPSSYSNPLKNLLIMISVKWLMEIKILEKSDLAGAKAVLFKIFLNALVFVSLTSLDKEQFLNMLKFPLFGFMHDIIIWFLMGIFMFFLNKMKFMDSRECMGSIWAAGSLAPVATAYVFGKEIYESGVTQMMMIDLGNKFWSLFVVSIAMNFYFGGKEISVTELSIKIIKMPIILSFLFAMIFIFIGIDVEKDMNITGGFLVSLKNIANPFIMVFIGMKVQMPSIHELKLFIPIFARRAMSLYITIISQLFMKLDEKVFRTY